VSQPILSLPAGLSFAVGARTVRLAPLELHEGEWAALSPARHALGPDLAVSAARVLSTLATPSSGTVTLFGQALHTLSYLQLLALRARLGFVPGAGGLLSSRTLRQNIALPVHTHRPLPSAEEAQLVQRALDELSLGRVADQRPHEVSGAARFRACVARALVLSPSWLVIEGLGDFDGDAQNESAWPRLLAYKAEQKSAALVCLARHNPTFERWFAQHGARIVPYQLVSELPSPEVRSARP
jgi:ABC-type lipoprotein export system ATPase subunit